MTKTMLDKLHQHVARQGLRRTTQRDLIARTFFQTKGHVSVEELLQKVKEADPKVGFATVYRTMKLLTDAGLAAPRSFGDGFTRWEVAGVDKHHHDHLICTECGEIVEFENDRIEQLQEAVARKHGYRIIDHKLELYGLCPKCKGLH